MTRKSNLGPGHKKQIRGDASRGRMATLAMGRREGCGKERSKLSDPSDKGYVCAAI